MSHRLPFHLEALYPVIKSLIPATHHTAGKGWENGQEDC